MYTRGSTAINAVTELTAGFDALQNSTITPEQNAALQRYYSDVYVKGLEGNTGVSTQAAGFIPTSPAERYVQAYYTVPTTYFAESLQVDDAGDGSAWSAAHAQLLVVPVAAVDRLVHENPALAGDIGKAIEVRRKRVVDACARSTRTR